LSLSHLFIHFLIPSLSLPPSLPPSLSPFHTLSHSLSLSLPTPPSLSLSLSGPPWSAGNPHLKGRELESGLGVALCSLFLSQSRHTSARRYCSSRDPEETHTQKRESGKGRHLLTCGRH